MDPELYRKILEHNSEAVRLRDRWSWIGLISSPALLGIGIYLLFHPIQATTNWGLYYSGAFFAERFPTWLIAAGLVFPYFSIRWLRRSPKSPLR